MDIGTPLDSVVVNKIEWAGLVADNPVLAISDAHLKDLRTPGQRKTYRRLVKLCQWAVERGMQIVFVGDTADVAAGHAPLAVIETHHMLFGEMLDGYDKVVYCLGNHDIAFGPDWDGVKDYVQDNILFKHAHDYFFFNYGFFGWTVGKPIVRIREWLKLPHKTTGWKKWLLQHSYFSNKAIFKRGPKDADERGCSYIVTGHTHQPTFKIVKGILVVNCGTIMNGDFVVISEKGIQICRF